jgi:hypothetical protein
MMRSVGVLGLLLLAGACGGPSATRPLSAVDAYVAALEAGDFGRAYDLMSEKYKKDHSREEFVKMMKESPSDVRETASRLRSGKRTVLVTARYSYDELRDEVYLVQEDGEWKIQSDPLNFYPQDSPKNTLRSFIRAVELKRYDVLLRFVPNQWRQAMTPEKLKAELEGRKRQEVEDLVRKLRVALDNPIEIQGDEARMEYGDRTTLKFKKEDGVWKIEDFE